MIKKQSSSEHFRSKGKLLIVLRIGLLFSMMGVMQVFASTSFSQSATFVIDVENKELKEVLAEIENQTDYKFAYDRSSINLSRKVSLKSEDELMNDVLNKLFKGSDINYKVLGKQIILTKKRQQASIVEITSEVQQEQRSISGIVTDASGEPLPGVFVMVKETTKGAITNVDGKYRIQGVKESDVLVFSFMGMKVQEMIVNKQSSINATMTEDAIGLDEVVAIGYGTAKKNDLTGAVTSVKKSQFIDAPTPNIAQSLQGKMSGVNIVNTTGAPGDTPKIIVRGVNSLSASNAPLIILDGIPFSGDLGDINSNDIEGLSVLKDASSSAIYGSRGANGVIIVTTKSGKGNKMLTSYHGSVGVQTMAKKMDLLNGTQYLGFLKDFNHEQGEDDLSPENLLFGMELSNYKRGVTTDWQDEVYRSAMYQDHQLSISGSSAKTKYYTSVAGTFQDGIAENTSFDRYIVRVNVTQSVTDWLSVGLNSQYTKKDYGGISPDRSAALRLSPYGQLKDESGNYTFYPEYPEVYYSNPFADFTASRDYTKERTDLFGTVDILLPIKGLNYKFNYGYTIGNTFRGVFYPKTSLMGSSDKGRATIYNRKHNETTLEHILSYNKEFNKKHKIQATGLYSWQSTYDQSNETTGKGFASDNGLYHTMQAAEKLEAESNLVETFLVSYMGRINYTYKNRYSLTATVRTDGYSAFGKNDKYATFPSLALAWNINQERFLNHTKTVDLLKIRLSWGKNGNQAISPYQTLDSYSIKNYVTGEPGETTTGYLISVIGNPSLKWETTSSTNLGVDFGFFNAITGTIDVYYSKTNDLLMKRTVPVMNGYTSVFENIGGTSNRGIEITLNGVCVDKKNLKWQAGLTFSANRDKIESLRGDGKDDVTNKWFIGDAVQVWYDYNTVGVFQTQEQIDKSSQPNARLGDAILEDVSDDGKITPEDRKIISSKNPDFRYGISNTLTYNNLSLSFFLSGLQGIKNKNYWLDPQTWLPEKNTNYLDIPYWSVNNINGSFVSPAYTGQRNKRGHAFYQNASYFRLQDVTLSYNIDANFMKRVKISDWQLYLSGRNLYTWTSWMGYNPESAPAYTEYPMARTVVLGTKFSF
ncbi:MAG: TonB-dependent receptor [Bacteroidales bacterium]